METPKFEKKKSLCSHEVDFQVYWYWGFSQKSKKHFFHISTSPDMKYGVMGPVHVTSGDGIFSVVSRGMTFYQNYG